MKSLFFMFVISVSSLPLLANWETYIQPIVDNDKVPFYLRKAAEVPENINMEKEVRQIVSMDRILGAKAAVVTKVEIAKKDKERRDELAGIPKPIPLEETKDFKDKQKALVDSMPIFTQENKGIALDELEKAKDQVKAQSLVEVVEEAIAPSSDIPLSKQGVPSFSLEKKEVRVTKGKDGKKIEKVVRIKVKEIPRLNIGQEKRIGSKGFQIPELQFIDAKYDSLQSLNSPLVETKKTIDDLVKQPIAKVVDHSKFELKELIEADSLVKRVNEAGYVLVKETNLQIKEIFKLSQDEMMFLQAEILYSKGDQCHAATGLYYELLDSKNSDYRSIAKLKVGICAHKMGLFTDSVKRLISVLDDKNEEAKKEALKALLAELPLEFQDTIGQYLEGFRDYHLLEESDKPAFNYVIAKSLATRDSFSKALQYAEKVPTGSQYYSRAQYVASVAEYVTGKVEASYRRQEALLNHLEKVDKKDPVYSLLAMQMARVSFQRRNYKEAISKFLEIDRTHPMWLQGLNQQAWAQLLIKDEPGAVGNMHSIHTPFFKTVYKPESYVIRALGYINLCQYADAYRSIQNLEGVYSPWLNSVAGFNKKNKTTKSAYYDLVADYLRDPKKEVVNGIPFQVIREVARHKDFLNTQDAINKTYDEKDQYSFILSLVTKEKNQYVKLKAQAGARKKQLLQNLKLAETDKKLLKDVNQWKLQVGVEDFLMDYYDFRIANYNFARRGMDKYAKVSNANLANRRTELKQLASNLVKKRMKGIEGQLSKLLQNNELLKYEIFSGAGENIRYRVSGGKTVGTRKPATSDLKKEALNWEFDGEFWEDEVGHYRSSLKNVCGQTSVQ